MGRILLEHGLKPGNLADCLSHFKGFPIDGRYSGRIVSPVFEALEGRYEDPDSLPWPDIANDAAHMYSFCLGGLPGQKKDDFMDREVGVLLLCYKGRGAKVTSPFTGLR